MKERYQFTIFSPTIWLILGGGGGTKKKESRKGKGKMES